MPSITSKLKKEHELDVSLTSEHKEQPKTTWVFNILGIPDEILIKIILYLNARERIPLGNSCKRFNGLVFQDEELLRNLNFSKDGSLTSMTDIQQYFNNKNTCRKILEVNIRNIGCMKPGRMLNNSIGKALNLVDVNIHGIEFIDIWQLGSFLYPLQHVQRLSFDWSETRGSTIPLCRRVLEIPFKKLKYLSVEMKIIECVKVFTSSLRLCQELEKLRIVVKKSNQTIYIDNWTGKPKKLRNLKAVEYCGPLAMPIKERIVRMLPNPEKWADFQLENSSNTQGFYLGMVEICEELLESKLMQSILNCNQENHFNLGWALVAELLLKEILRVTYENVPEEFCCLSTFKDRQRCLLKIHEAERLLKNPRSQISYLFVNHPIHIGCDIHLVASAFLNLTELVLAAVTRNQKIFPKDSHFQKCLKKRGNAAPGNHKISMHLDSSFKMLVENTPHVRHFTLGGCGSHTNWDLDELHLIPKWKFLETLRLLEIPIKDGEFLIEVGQQCKNLQHLELIHLGSRACCYEKDLLQMLEYCRNLRDFSIESKEIGAIATMFTLLAHNVHLRRVRAKTGGHNVDCFIRSAIQLFDQCSELSSFVGEFNDSRLDNSAVSSDLERLKAELDHLNLQIKVNFWSRIASIPLVKQIGNVYEDSPRLNPFPQMWSAN